MNEINTNKIYNKSACFTDIHFGKKSNSEVHNKDCLRFVEFFCETVKQNKDIDHIVFLGDWFDHRNAINISTLNYSYSAMKLLNELNMDIFWIIGNHDLYMRNTRDVHSLPYLDEFKNFILIEKPTIVNKNILFLPYLFEEEYSSMQSVINNADIIYGHLELKGFVVTGASVVLEHGPEHELFSSPKRIFTGHFHKRQIKDNVIYIGNTFPHDFSDTNDTERGLAVYDYINDEIEFFDWSDAPSYIRCDLSNLIKNHKKILRKDATVRCLVDIDIDLEQSLDLKEMLISKYQLREISFEELAEEINLDDEKLNLEGFELESTDDIIIELLKRIETNSLDKEKLIKIYKGLK